MSNIKTELQRLAIVLNNPAEFYQNVINTSDPRVADWMWMHSPLPTVCLVLLYLAFCNFGPKMMKDRKPFDMKLILFVSSVFQVVLNVWMIWELTFGMIGARHNYFKCVPMAEYSYDPSELRLARVLWWYYFTKFIDFSDTVFFILRKKNSQITFLHIYHHASMFFWSWIGVKWVAGGQSTKAALTNCIVHAVMYSYYALSALGPKIRPYLWWKHHITHLQLIQFFVGLSHMSYSLYVDCNFPKWMHYIGLSYLMSLVILFSNFYIQAYIKGKRLGGTVTKENKSEHLATNGTSFQIEGNKKKDN